MKINAGSQFLRNIMTLAGGSAIAQVIPLVAIPFISRLYDPNEMGIFGVYLAIISIAGVASTLRYENSILIPENHDTAFSLVLGAAGVVCLSAALMMGVVLVFPGYKWEVLSSIAIGGDWIVLPLGMFGVGMVQVLSIWAVRKKNFKLLAGSRIVQSSSSSGLQLLLGYLGVGYFGLIFGQLSGQLLACIQLSLSNIKKFPGNGYLFSSKEIVGNLLAYRRFPIYSLPADMINVVTNYMPLLLLGIYFEPAAVGLYAMAQKIVGAPLALVGNATLDVFKETAAREYRISGSCRRLCFATMGLLFAISAVPFAFLVLYGADLFGFVLGDRWRGSGTYAQLLCPLLLARFVVSPISYVLLIAQRQDIDLVWQASLLVISVVSISIGGLIGKETWAIALFSSLGALMYVVYGLIAVKIAKKN